MDKKWIPVIVAVIGTIGGIVGGGEATNWSFQVGDNTNTVVDQSQASGDTTINEGDTFFGDIKEEAILTAICLQDPIPEEYQKACSER